jgi:hypothetical protein
VPFKKKICVPHPYKRTVEVKLLSSSLTTRIEINVIRIHVFFFFVFHNKSLRLILIIISKGGRSGDTSGYLNQLDIV